MKTLFKNSKLTILAFLVLFVGMNMSCDTTGIQNAIDDFGLVIGLESINTGATVLITDAATGELINANIDIIYAGQNGGNVIDMYSDPIDADEVSNGILNFAIDNSVVPSSENQAKVQLQLSAPGYISANKTIAIPDTGFFEFSVSLVNSNNKPAGVKSTTASATTNSDGSLAEDLVVNTNSDGSGDQGLNIAFPAGTIITDSQGNALSGSLRAEVVGYDPGDTEALASVPYDNDEVNGILAQETGEEGVAVTLGANTVQITDSNGKRASKVYANSKSKAAGITTSYTVTLEVSPDAGFETGDQVLFYALTESYDYYYDYVTIQDIGEGKIGVQVEPSELFSIFLILDWGSFSFNSSDYRNYSNFDISYNGYSGKISGTANSYGLSYSFNVNSNGFGYMFFGTGGNYNTVHVTDPVDVVLDYTGSLPASGSTLPIVLPQAPTNLIDVAVNVPLVCPDPDQKVAVTNIPQSSVLFRKVGSTGKWRVVTAIKWKFDEDTNSLTSGSFNIVGVEQGANYDFKFIYDGNTEEKVVNMSGTTVSVSISEEIESICE